MTRKQRRGICPGNYNNSGSADSELCSDGCASRATRNGFTTGVCDTETGFCFVHSWCPLEPPDEQLPLTDMIGVQNFTLFLRANVQFPLFGITIDNVGAAAPQLFQPGADNARASVWRLRDVLELAGAHNITRSGAVIGETCWCCFFELNGFKLECLIMHATLTTGSIAFLLCRSGASTTRPARRQDCELAVVVVW